MNANNQESHLWEDFKHLPFTQQLAIALLVFLVPLIVVALYKPIGIFYHTQNLYYLHGLYEAGVDFLQNDPTAITRPTHLLFSELVALLQRMNWLAGGSQFLAVVLLIVFGFACVLTAIGIASGWRDQTSQRKYHVLLTGITIAAIFALLINRTAVTILHGMAMMNIPGWQLEASSFGVFASLAIGFMALRRWRAATASCILASIMHSNFLILCSPLMLMVFYETYRQGKVREGIRLLVIFALVNLPLFVLGPLQWSQVNSAQAIHILNQIRSPLHYNVNYWWNEIEFMRLLLLGLATILAIWKLSSVLRNIMVFYFAYIVLGLGIVASTGNETVASLLPWRASAFLIPLSELIIVATLVLILFEIIPPKIHALILFAACVLAVAYWITLKPWVFPDAYVNYTSPEIEMVDDYTQTNDIILIPPQMDVNFRLYARRPTFVMWETTGYFVEEWYNRILIAEEMMTTSAERQREICQDYEIDYYLIPLDAPAAKDVTPIASTDDYLLLACP